MIAAHLDISFEPGVNVKVRKEGARWYGPGLSDDSRGLVALLAVAEAMNDAAIATDRSLLFVANTGEEGLGDLKGVKYLFQESPHRSQLKAFISVDESSLDSMTTGGTGVRRFKVTVRGPGGHSYVDFGRPSAVHTLGRIVADVAAIEVPAKPKATYNVGRVGGWHGHQRHRRRGVGRDRPAFRGSRAACPSRPASDPLVRAALEAHTSVRKSPRLEIGSTDANLPMSLGIPAITISRGGQAGNAHSLNEWFEPAEAWLGPQAVLLTILNYDRRR